MENINFDLAAQIEAILFYTAEPMSLRKLAGLLKADQPSVKAAAATLRVRLDESGGGVRLLEQNGEIALGTAPDASALIEAITRDEISKELSKASLETLSIICYKGPLTRADIDYIRGVNSTFILRNLLVRGIVEKQENPRDARAALYAPTLAALEYMGVTRREDLPNFEEIQAQLAAFAASKAKEEEHMSGENEEATPSEEEPVATTIEEYDDAEAAYTDDSSNSTPVTCDSDGDGSLTSKECVDMGADGGETMTENVELEADVSEEDLMAPSFDDEAVAVHNAKDAAVDSSENAANHDHEHHEE